MQIKNGFCGIEAQKLNLALNPLSCKTLVSGCGCLFTLCLIHLSVNQKTKKTFAFSPKVIFSKNSFV